MSNFNTIPIQYDDASLVKSLDDEIHNQADNDEYNMNNVSLPSTENCPYTLPIIKPMIMYVHNVEYNTFKHVSTYIYLTFLFLYLIFTNFIVLSIYLFT